MRRAAAIAIGLVSAASVARADVKTVETNTSEVRACLPLDGGDALIGTGGGLVRVDEKGAPRGVWTASDGLPGTRIDGITQVGAEIWIATDGGAAKISADADGGVTIDHVAIAKPALDVMGPRPRGCISTCKSSF